MYLVVSAHVYDGLPAQVEAGGQPQRVQKVQARRPVLVLYGRQVERLVCREQGVQVLPVASQRPVGQADAEGAGAPGKDVLQHLISAAPS